MSHTDLLNMNLRDFCDLFRNGSLPEQFSDMSLTEIVNAVTKESDGEKSTAEEEQQVGPQKMNVLGSQVRVELQDDEQETSIRPHPHPGRTDAQPHGVAGSPAQEQVRQQEQEGDIQVLEKQKKTFQWREKLPNSNNTNPPILLWRGDENSSATTTLAFGLYDDEFRELQSEHILEVDVKDTTGESIKVKFDVDLDYPKDEKLSRKHAGLAGSGSDNLCTYCNQSRKTVKDPPQKGDNPVTLTNTLLREASHYCQLNPDQKSQEQLSKIAHGVKEVPLSSTEPKDERPDSLHMDLNVTKQLVNIASRLYHHKVSGQPLKYEKTGIDKKEMESNEALYYQMLRGKISTLPELTQCPGNFFREYMDEANKEFVKEPLPNVPDTTTWNDLMELWRKMRAIHKSSKDPTDDEIEQFKTWVIEFQEKIFSLSWVPVANQIHRLSHLAFFMQSKPIKSIGAYSLEGLEHGNFSTKDGEMRRVWKGNSKEGNKQLFRLLRMQSSPTLRRVAVKLQGKKRKQMKCSKCHKLGHTKRSSKCRFFDIDTAEPGNEVEEDGEILGGPDDNDDECILGGSDDEDEEIIETIVIVDDDTLVDDENTLDDDDDSFNQCNTS
jgi:hypothetical protein